MKTCSRVQKLTIYLILLRFRDRMPVYEQEKVLGLHQLLYNHKVCFWE